MAAHSSTLAWRIPMDRGARGATDHGVAKCRTQLKRLSTHSGVKPATWGIRWRCNGQDSPLSLPKAGVHVPASQACRTPSGHVRWRQKAYTQLERSRLASREAVQLSLTLQAHEGTSTLGPGQLIRQCFCCLLLERPFWSQTEPGAVPVT